jgi:GTP-binding protein
VEKPAAADPRLEAGRILFAGACVFVASVARIEQMPPAVLPEVAFAGRSNVGKSSLVNALTGRKTLARVSNTPGRTRMLNFFNLAGRLSLVDLPGYGYARASQREIEAWTGLVFDYLRGRPGLARVLLLIDARHGLKEADCQAMMLMDKAAVVYQVVLTKIDKIAKAEPLRTTLAAELRRHPAAYPEIAMTSSRTAAGIPELRAALAELAEPRRFWRSPGD